MLPLAGWPNFAVSRARFNPIEYPFNIEKKNSRKFQNRFFEECYQNICSLILVRDIPYLYLIFVLDLKVFTNKTKYTSIVFINKRQSIVSHSLTGSRECEQAALRNLAYSEAAGQTLVSMNEWEASEAYHHP